MAIKAACPECGETYRFSPDKTGRKIRCRSCNEVFTIQAPPFARKPKSGKKKSTQGEGKPPRKKTARPSTNEEYPMPLWQVGLACLGVVAMLVVGFFTMPGSDEPNLITALITDQPDATVSHAGFVESVEVTPYGLKISSALPQEPVIWEGTFVELLKRGEYTQANITLTDPAISLPVVVQFWVEENRTSEWLTVPKGTKIQFKGTFDEKFTIVSLEHNIYPIGQTRYVYNEMESRDIKSKSVSDPYKVKFPRGATQYWFSLNDVSLVDYTPPESMSTDSSIASFLESQKVVTELNDDGQLVGLLCGKMLDLTLMPTIAQLKHLKSFRIVTADFNDEHLKKLTACQSIEELWLSQCQVTTNGLRQLSEFPNLGTLFLTNSTLITDEVVPILENLKTLKLIDISNTNVTRTGIDRLEETFPYIAVISDKTGNQGWQQSISFEAGTVISRLLFSPDSSAVYTADSKNNKVIVRRHSLAKPAAELKLEYPGKIQELLPGDKPDKIFVAYVPEAPDNENIKVDRFPGGENAFALPGNMMKLSPDQKTILVADRANQKAGITLHDAATGKQLAVDSKPGKYNLSFHDFHFTTDSKQLLKRTDEGITLLDLIEPTKLARVDFVSFQSNFAVAPPIPITQGYWIFFDQNGLFILDRRENFRAKPQQIKIPAYSGVYDPLSGHVIAYELDGPIRVVDPLKESVLGTIPNDSRLSRLTLTNDGRHIKANSMASQGSLLVWDLESMEQIANFSKVFASEFSADSKLLASFEKDSHRLSITSLQPHD